MAKKKSILTPEQRRATTRRLLRFAKPYIAFFIIAFIFAAASSVMAHLIPMLVGDAIDLAIGQGKVDIEGVFALLPIMLAFALGGALLDWLVRLVGQRISASITHNIRAACIRKIQNLPLSYLDSHKSGDILSRVIADTDRLSEGLMTGIIDLYSSVIGIIVTLVFMIFINPVVAIVVGVLTPMSMLVAAFIANRTFSLFGKKSAIAAKQTAVIDEAVAGREVISLFSHEGESLAAFDEINEEYRKTATRAVFYSSITNPATRYVNSLVYGGVALAGGLLSIASGGAISAGEISCLLTYSQNYAKPFNELSSVLAELQSSLASAMRVFEFLDAKEEETTADISISPDAVKGELKARDVAFSYTDEPFMENIDFEASSGQRIAIVGPTGCGKTTLINLLMRFYDTTGGSICVDGKDISKISRRELRACFGMVLQDTWLSSGSVRENIAMGKPDATDEEIVAAAKAAHAHKFIMRLPQGYDTPLGEDGSVLSAGQIQLLCIARVMLALPPMLILDEATSSIDTRTEIKIQDAFAEMMKGRTSFIVAHRLNTIKNADKILVMKDGKIVEQGRHDELMAKNGFYASLYGAQFKMIN
jgi:ATP-binding cassette subfamily B protein